MDVVEKLRRRRVCVCDVMPSWVKTWSGDDGECVGRDDRGWSDRCDVSCAHREILIDFKIS